MGGQTRVHSLCFLSVNIFSGLSAEYRCRKYNLLVTIQQSCTSLANRRALFLSGEAVLFSCLTQIQVNYVEMKRSYLVFDIF